MISVLFVCMGNICRSPMAEGVFRRRVIGAGLEAAFHIDSAGTTGYHVGSQPDYRAQATTVMYGTDISEQRSRQLRSIDFHEFDYILAMDRDNYHDMISVAPEQNHNRISLFLSYHESPPTREVPDPYYGGDDGFDLVYDLVDGAAEGLLDKIIDKHNLKSNPTDMTKL